MAKIGRERFLKVFPVFRNGPKPLVDHILASSHHTTIPPDILMQFEGQAFQALGLMLCGEKRIYKVSESGNEITLYEVGAGETCIINASCIISNVLSPVCAASLTAVEEILLPASDFRRLVATYEEMRAFVFSHISQSFASIMELIVEVAFKRMDRRLIDYILDKSQDGKLWTTHQKIANDLGTAREVISRLLKDMEKKGMIIISRNLIQLANLDNSLWRI